MLTAVETDQLTAGSPTDDAVVTVYTTLDASADVWTWVPLLQFTLERWADPNRASFTMSNCFKFRVGVKRSGTTDTGGGGIRLLRNGGH